MAKQMVFEDEARQPLLAGVAKLARAVRSTLGPRGRCAVLDKGWGSPKVTKDGVTLAEEIDLEGAGRAYHKILLRDIAPVSPEMLRDAIVWIREAIKLHVVLIFCNAGISRAPSIAIAYLCSVGFGYDEALRFVSARRAEIAPLPNLASSIEDCISFYL